MKISEYICRLEQVKAELGDVEVHHDEYAGRFPASQPKAGYALVLKGRESRPRFWHIADGEDRKGEPLCRV